MERTRPQQRDPVTSNGAGTDGDGVDTILAQEILAAADRVLDSIRPINAQQYLEQNQQRGGQ